MEKQTITRQELYDLVWSIPMIRLAEKYKISDNGLRKICKKMNIPLPGNGYWQKLRYHKTVKKKPLPKNFSGKDQISLSDRDIEDEMANSPSYHKKALLKSYECLDKSLFRVPDRLSNPDKLITAAQKTLIHDKPRRFLSDSLVHTYSGELDIKVSPENISRALRFFDTFIKLVRSRNHIVDIVYNKTRLVMGDEYLEIALREKLRIERVLENNWRTNKYFKTGILVFQIQHYSYQRVFQDTLIKLEDKLPMILAEAESWAEKEKKERIIREEHWAREQEKERIRKERQERKEKELNDFKNLLNESSQWHKAITLENYIREVENKALEQGTLTQELKDWLAWAKQKAAWFNPFVKKEDEYLNDNDRFAI